MTSLVKVKFSSLRSVNAIQFCKEMENIKFLFRIKIVTQWTLFVIESEQTVLVRTI